MSAPVNVDEKAFEDQLGATDELVLVDFWAPWCGPCKMIAPVLEELATEYAGKVRILKVNVDDNQALAGRYGIRSIPSLLFFRGGQVVDQVVGASPKATLAQKLDALTNKG